VNTVNLFGGLSADPAPDLVDRDPTGNRLFVSLGGPMPLSGDPHNATGLVTNARHLAKKRG
jgi:hypothetical protein